MFRSMFAKIVFYCLKKSLKTWLRIIKKDPSGEIEETVIELVEEGKTGSSNKIDEDERAILHNVLELRDTQVNAIKIARAEIVALPDTANFSHILDLMIEKNMTQLIIYKGEIDHILGYVTCEDVFACYKDKNCTFEVSHFLKPIEFIAPSLPILDCLLNMREKGQKMAIVVDEYGAVDGLVTFTDLIEEIIGDIQQQESVNPPGQIVINDDQVVVVDGYTRIDDLNEALGTEFHGDEDVLTIAGMICNVTGRLPARGEVISYKEGTEFVILDATPRKIKKIAIRGLKIKAS